MPLGDGDALGRAELVPYDDAWERLGKVVVEELSGALGPAALRVDHIGSTAIPGMAAKPILDVQVCVADLDAAAAACDGVLAARGFERKPDARDHVPAGRPDDRDDWNKRYWSRRPARGQPVNLHVRVSGAPNARLALLFRDWLRAHPLAVAAYSRFKILLADAVADQESYTDVKDPVVDIVVAAAEEWAAATHWAP